VALPFGDKHLRTGTPKEVKTGKWGWRKNKENWNERILGAQERLVVDAPIEDGTRASSRRSFGSSSTSRSSASTNGVPM
jgi:hypothetical protein